VLDYRAEDLVVAMIFNTYAGGYPPAEKLAALFRGALGIKPSGPDRP